MIGMSEKRFGTKKLALSVVLAAAVTVSTMIIQIQIPATLGYLNFGDVMVFVSGLMFGGLIGGFAGGVGSAVADVMLGYPHYALYTLVIKGLEGFLAGQISDGGSSIRDAAGWAAGATVMVVGYLAVQSYMFGISVALVELPVNLVQVGCGAFIGIPVARTLRKRIPIVHLIHSSGKKVRMSNGQE